MTLKEENEVLKRKLECALDFIRHVSNVKHAYVVPYSRTHENPYGVTKFRSGNDVLAEIERIGAE